MPRSKAKYHYQPNDFTCGPAALKTALEILGKRHTIEDLIKACNTNTRGTTVKNMLKAITDLGYCVMAIEWATLKHLQSALKVASGQPKSIIVNYQESGSDNQPDGHYATVAGFSSRTSRIFLFDTWDGGKKSYKWTDFINLWWDYDFKRTKRINTNKKFKLSKKYYNRLMLIITSKKQHLPKFAIKSQRCYYPD